ncbi:MAG TPA: hypothetical protein VE951_06475 [Candidatus Angelobacter sp.]|jgi:hypothetical protein|nr:hypothetical protein [Candidatus Angelobacter sp.]
MFRLTKIKIASAIAAGAVSLGAAGAYAANNGTTTLTTKPTELTLSAPNGATLKVDGLTATQQSLPAFQNQGQCVSYFAKSKDYALAKSVSSDGTKLNKNFHGVLMSSLGKWCANFAKSAATVQEQGDSSETPEADADSTDSTDSGQGKGHGHGHGHGHGRPTQL